MATPVGWSYGPWRSQQTSATPYATVPGAAEILPGATAGQLERLVDSNAGPGGFSGPDVAGPMTSTERSTLGQISGFPGTQVAEALGLSGIPGSAVRGGVNIGTNVALGSLGPVGAIKGAVGLFGGLASLIDKLGLQGYRSLVGPTAAEAQSMADRYGYGQPTPYGEVSPSGIVGGTPMDIDSARGLGGPGDSNGGPGTGQGGQAGTGSESEGGAARGGVFKSRPGQPRTMTFGEGEAAGKGETGVFVPEYMKQPGQQGREPQVEQMMRTLLRALRR